MASIIRTQTSWIVLLICILAASACSDGAMIAEGDSPNDIPPDTGTIQVTIFFEGTEFSGIPVILRDPTSGENLEVVDTGTGGVSLLENIAPGDYTILLSIPSFWRPEGDPISSVDVNLAAGETVDLTFRFASG